MKPTHDLMDSFITGMKGYGIKSGVVTLESEDFDCLKTYLIQELDSKIDMVAHTRQAIVKESPQCNQISIRGWTIERQTDNKSG
jgi:hypothetical protein